MRAVRVRQWLAGRQSFELSVGYASDVLTKEGVVGPVVSLRYGAHAWSHVQVGATRIRNVTSITDLTEPRVEETSAIHAHGGIGVGGAGGLIAWGLQAIGSAALMAMLGGMS